MRTLLMAVRLLLPWELRRWWLGRVFGYEIHPTARIGRSWVMPGKLVMEAGARIGSGTVCKGVELVEMKQGAHLGNLNWVTGLPTGGGRYFLHQPERRPELRMGRHASVTNRHLIDCTGTVTIGAFATLAGFQSQILTHSIDLAAGRQASEPVEIGEYCFVGTNCVLLGGSVLPERSVLGAKSLLNKAWAEGGMLYGGVPAKLVRKLPVEEMAYFRRAEGWVE